jgi:hypothetical protein
VPDLVTLAPVAENPAANISEKVGHDRRFPLRR